MQTYNRPQGSTSVKDNLLTNVDLSLEAIRSSFSGASSPTNPTPIEGQLWWDETNGKLCVYDGSGWNGILLGTIRWVDVGGYSSLSEAITAIGSTPTTLVISTAINASNSAEAVTVPATLSLFPMQGGVISKGSATSLTIGGPIMGCPMHQWLNGFTTGLLWGINVQEVCPEWFGAKGDGVVSYDDRVYVSGTNDSSALQACFNSVMNSQYRPKITLGAKLYYYLTPLTITYARGMRIDGANGGLFGDTDTGYRYMVTTLLYNGSTSNASALTIGNASQSATGFVMNNVFINAGSVAGATSGVNGLRLNWASGGTFRDGAISNFRGASNASGVVLEGTQLTTFYNYGFTNNTNGSYEKGTARENTTNRFYNCIWHTNGRGHYGTGSTGTLLQSPTFQNNEGAAVKIDSPSYNTNSLTIDDYYIASNCSATAEPAIDIQGSASYQCWNPRVGPGFFASAGTAQTASIRYKYTRQGTINNPRMGDITQNKFFIDSTNYEFMFLGWNSSLGNAFMENGSGAQMPWPRLGVEQPYFLTSYSPFKALQGKTDLNTAALTLEQLNVTKALVNHIGTSEAGVSKNLSSWAGGATTLGYVKTEVNGTPYWIPYCTEPSSNNASFSAHKNGTGQVIATGTFTKLTFTTAVYGSSSAYNAANSKWTPGMVGVTGNPGQVHVGVTLTWESGVDGADMYIYIYISGVGSVYSMIRCNGTGSQGHSISHDFAISSTDYVEIYVRQETGGNVTVNGLANGTFFTGRTLP